MCHLIFQLNHQSGVGMLLFAVLCQLTFLPIYHTAAVMLLVVLCQLNFSINPARVNRYSAGTLWVIGLFLQNRQSEVCMLLFCLRVTGTCGWLQVLRRAPQVTPGGVFRDLRTSQYPQMTASTLRGSSGTPPGTAGLCGYSAGVHRY